MLVNLSIGVVAYNNVYSTNDVDVESSKKACFAHYMEH